MSTFLKQIDETYEVDTEEEATKLIEEMKVTFTVTRSSCTYRYKKTEDREFYIVAIRKSFVEDKVV